MIIKSIHRLATSFIFILCLGMVHSGFAMEIPISPLLLQVRNGTPHAYGIHTLRREKGSYSCDTKIADIPPSPIATVHTVGLTDQWLDMNSEQKYMRLAVEREGVRVRLGVHLNLLAQCMTAQLVSLDTSDPLPARDASVQTFSFNRTHGLPSFMLILKIGDSVLDQTEFEVAAIQ